MSAPLRLCGYEGCSRPHESRGYCSAHAAQVRAGLALAPILSRGESARRNLRVALAMRPRGRAATTCESCGQRFERYVSQPKRRFCSRACAYVFMRGPNGAAALRPSNGATQPRVCGEPDGLPFALAGHSWPARPGEAQHAGEAPRLAAGIPERVSKLRALGNAVVPQQALPLFQAIAAYEQESRP